MTDKRRKQLERLLWKLRADARLFELDQTQSGRISHAIKSTKIRLMPEWTREHKQRQDAEFCRRYAADTAVNYYPRHA